MLTTMQFTTIGSTLLSYDATYIFIKIHKYFCFKVKLHGQLHCTTSNQNCSVLNKSIKSNELSFSLETPYFPCHFTSSEQTSVCNHLNPHKIEVYGKHTSMQESTVLKSDGIKSVSVVYNSVTSMLIFSTC